jgi:hydrogenase expression/formation protein HypE
MTTLPVGKLPNELLQVMLENLPSDPDVVVGPGIGRDAAAVRVGDQILVFKTDPITFPTDDAGRYLVNINANDIACMGAEPRWLLVTALLPESATTPELVEGLFSSLRSASEELGCTLIGGHTEITEGLDRPILVGQMIGSTTSDQLIDPSGSQPDDAVILIGGIAVEGTAILATDAADHLERTISPELLARARTFSHDPGISIVSYARTLTHRDDVAIKALHDPTEGGLATGIRELADATGQGIEIDASKIHIYSETQAIADSLQIDPWGLIASGALLAVVSQESVAAVSRAFVDSGVPVAQIGRLTADRTERTLIIDGERGAIPQFAVDEIARYFSES